MERVLAAATQTVGEELTDVALPVHGDLPAAIDGCYFRNGPGRFERGGQRYRHPFDGDGHITKLDMRGGQVRYSNRFVRTREYLEEERAGRMRYRAFGTNLPGGLFANLFRLQLQERRQHQRALARRAAAGALGGRPALSAGPDHARHAGHRGLRRRPEEPVLGPVRWLAPLLPFSAHPHLDAGSGVLYNFGLVSGSPNRLMLYRVGADGRMDSRAARAEALQLSARLRGHPPLALLPAALRGLRLSRRRCSDSRPRSARCGSPPSGPCRSCCCRASPAGAARDPVRPAGLRVPRRPAFDDGRNLVLDVIRFGRYPDFDAFEELFRNPPDGVMPRLERLVHRPGAGRCERLSLGAGQRRARLRAASQRPGGPRRAAPHPLRRRRPAGAARALPDLDPAPGHRDRRPHHPRLRPRPGRRADARARRRRRRGLAPEPGVPRRHRRTDLLVLRAADLSTQATVALPHGVPIGFHGCWVPRGELDRPRR
jgi:all-trans-8'-apo-beta-carotenal 15,15'-oxygenase